MFGASSARPDMANSGSSLRPTPAVLCVTKAFKSSNLTSKRISRDASQRQLIDSKSVTILGRIWEGRGHVAKSVL